MLTIFFCLQSGKTTKSSKSKSSKSVHTKVAKVFTKAGKSKTSKTNRQSFEDGIQNSSYTVSSQNSGVSYQSSGSEYTAVGLELEFEDVDESSGSSLKGLGSCIIVAVVAGFGSLVF